MSHKRKGHIEEEKKVQSTNIDVIRQQPRRACKVLAHVEETEERQSLEEGSKNRIVDKAENKKEDNELISVNDVIEVSQQIQNQVVNPIGAEIRTYSKGKNNYNYKWRCHNS